jgi:C4-dicarboxylate-specific signal transduction histidine kinase
LNGDVRPTEPSRLVIVDDEPSILSLLVSIFKDSGFDVVGYKDGRSALAGMEAHGVDVLLTDKNLPDVGGLELLERAHAIQPDAEVILITGYASLDTALKAIELGAFDYILKPPKNIFDVRRKVCQAMERVAVVRENQRLLAHLKTKNTALAEAVDEMKTLQREVIQSEKLAGIGTLAAGMAHEVSSPLFGIMGLAEAIEDEEDLDLVHSYASEIVLYSKSIKEIVQQLSGYARTPASHGLAPVGLHGCLEGAAKLVCRSIQADISAVAITAPLHLNVLASPNELQQVFVNLIKNGIDAVVDRHGEVVNNSVDIRAKMIGDEVEIYVSDRGNGIPEEQRQVVFNPFFTTKEPGKGTGLGLNIVYRIIAKYRGNIWVEEAEGGGALFRVRLTAGEA